MAWKVAWAEAVATKDATKAREKIMLRAGDLGKMSDLRRNKSRDFCVKLYTRRGLVRNKLCCADEASF